MFYPKLVHELNKRVSNKQDIRFFVFAVGHKAVVLQKEKRQIYRLRTLHEMFRYTKHIRLNPKENMLSVDLILVHIPSQSNEKQKRHLL